MCYGFHFSSATKNLKESPKVEPRHPDLETVILFVSKAKLKNLKASLSSNLIYCQLLYIYYN